MKTLKLLCAIFALVTGTLCAQTAIDSKTAGRAFARDGMWDSYTFYGEYDIDQNEVFRHFTGQMDLGGKIVALTVDDVVIVEKGDTPLPGLPYVANGTITRFWLNLDARKGNESVASGGVWQERLRENQALTVTLYPSWELGFLEYKLPEKGDNQPLLVDENGDQVGWYDYELKGFRYQIDPLGGAFYAYVMIGNRKFASFVIDPFETAQSSDSNLVNVELAGGVVRVVMNQWNHARQDVNIDGQTEVDGIIYPAKAFILDTEGDYFHISSHNEDGAGLRMEVYDVGDGRFEQLYSGDYQPVGFQDYHNVRYFVPSGYGKIMVIIVDTINGETRSANTFFSKGKQEPG